MRRVGVLDREAPDVRPHDHVAWSDAGSAGFARLVHHVVATAPDDVQLFVVAGFDDTEHDPRRAFAEDADSGRVRVLDAHDMYAAVLADGADAEGQLASFDQELQSVLDSGLSGIRVVADNTPMLTGSAANYERWLAWEQITDRWQAVRPVTGICYFDSTLIDPDRLALVDAIHPIGNTASARGYTLFHDNVGDVAARLALAGTVELWHVDELVGRIVAHFADVPSLERAIDLSNAEYVHHQLLFALRQHEIAAVDASDLVAHLARIVDHLG